MEGVKTSQADIFFAGVKTRWHNAEEQLDRLRANTPLFSRLHALRVIARIASHQHSGDDLLPLKLNRLKGAGGRKLIDRMEELCGQSRIRKRIETVSAFLVNESGLGYALHFVDSQLVDHVFGWALSGGRLTQGNLQLAANYLFWGTAFRLNPVFRETFSRGAMSIAVSGGSSAFPLEEILGYVGKTWPELGYRRSAIARPFDEGGKLVRDNARAAVNQRGRLFLAMAQEIPFEPGFDIDWEHILPQARRSILKWRGRNVEKRLVLHGLSGHIWRAGNLCALENRLNQKLGRRPAYDKQRLVQRWKNRGNLRPAELFITTPQWQEIAEADRQIERNRNPWSPDKNTAMDEAMHRFASFVSSREDRMWDKARKEFPKWSLFRDCLFKKQSAE